MAVDTEDDERADVYDVNWDGISLRYCLYWRSTGRFSKERLMLVEKDKVAMTYTYTDEGILHRKPKQTRSKAQRGTGG